jgi:hypothetical protein
VTSDYLALFITDINRAFEGLVVSLDQDPPAMQQGALHARDLADALGSVGLAQISALTSDISGQLGLENPSILPVAKGFVELLKKALLALESGNPNAPLPEQIAVIGEITAAMSELMSPRLEHASQPKGLMEFQNDAPAVPPTRHSAPEVLAPVVHLTQSADLQILFPLRRNGLNIVQRVREMVSHSGVGNSTEMDFLLAEHQDALTSLGQLELKMVLQAHADYVEADGVYADSDIIEALSLALGLLPSGFSVHASKQALSLFIDIRGIHIDGAQMEAFGAAIQKIMGRVDQTSAYLRVVLPSSLKRIRMLPFKRADVLYAISWVQLCSISGLDSPMGAADLLGGVADAQKRMHLCSGVDLHTIYASEIFPVMNMNTFLLPGLLSGPPWMKGVALDGASRPYTWVYL